MRRIIRAIALTLIAAGLATSLCSADVAGGSRSIPPVTTNIPVRHIITGDTDKCREDYTFVLAAEREGTPMPAGSDGRIRKVTVTGKGDPDFGSITFTYPDAYYYTVSCGDDSYRVMIAMYNNGTSQMVAWDSSGSKAEEIVFTDEFLVPEKSRSPKTGDDVMSAASAYAALMGLSVLLLVIFLVKRKADDNGE